MTIFYLIKRDFLELNSTKRVETCETVLPGLVGLTVICVGEDG